MHSTFAIHCHRNSNQRLLIPSILKDLEDLQTENEHFPLKPLTTRKKPFDSLKETDPQKLLISAIKRIAIQYKKLPLNEIIELLHSGNKNERLCAVLLMTLQYKESKEEQKGILCSEYLKHTHLMDSKKLIDCSASKIVGVHYQNYDRSILYKLAQSEWSWDRRIAVLACRHYISNYDYGDPLKIAQILLSDSEIQIQEAVGWMLNEIGKQDKELEEEFLLKHRKHMPENMLRSAVRDFNQEDKDYYLEFPISKSASVPFV